MDFELWWLLPIPVLFFALGWIAARIDIKHLLTESRALPLSYFRGLNFLLNEQPDKAIESFIEVVKVDPQTIDLHFALGSLFRRQGEVDRAIRMHQNLLDRAEDLFVKLDGTPYEHAAQGFLLSIYETEKDWQKAIAITRRMEAVSKTPQFKEIAHYHCEMAQAALARSDFATAATELERARAENRACTRATMIAGDLEAQQQDLAAAIETWSRIESQNPPFLALVAERVANAYTRLSDVPSGIRRLSSWQSQYPSLDILNALFTLVLAHEGPAAAADLIRAELAKTPTLIGLDRLLEAQLAAAPPERRHDLELVKALVGQHIKRLGMYRCEQCGFRARQYYWRCPGCQRWETYSPRRTESAEPQA